MRKRGFRVSYGAAIALSIGLCGGALAATPQQTIESRQANFKAMGTAFKGINDELKKDTPDTALVRANARKMKDLSAQLPKWFPKGSGPETGSKTGALPVIWTDGAGFAKASNDLGAEIDRLQQAAGSSDLSALRAQVRATGAACKSCHQTFREPDKR